MKMPAVFLIFSALLSLPTLHAGEIEALSRTYSHSCGYFSNRVSEVEIIYKNNDLGWGTKIEAIYGYEGYLAHSSNPFRVPFEWREERIETIQASGPHTWAFTHFAYIHDRSSPKYIEAINIVFRVTHPNGTVVYENGTQTPWGFYRILLASDAGCVSDGVPLPRFESSVVQLVERY